VVATERALSLANKRYREGYSDFQRVLDAQRALFVQTEREVVNQGNHISSAINLYKALGGGWLDTTIEQAVPIELRDTMAARSDWGDLLDAALPLNSDEPPPNTSAVQNER
jgi:hypothetical protein